MKYLLLSLLFIGQLACAAPREIDSHHWDNVDRIIAIGDIHGDYDNYMETLQAAQLVNSRGKWIGGQAHLVQTGDIPDRGPDTRKIIKHIQKLAKEAKKKGGRVHSLIGNHEAMNVTGDLRYVSAGEFKAFETRGSKGLVNRYYDLVMQDLLSRDPDAYASLPENYREEWDETHPPGWIEHRQSWDPAWNPDGELANWVMQRQVVIQVNDLIFLHGGISGFYCQNSLQSMTDKVVSKLKAYDPKNPGILEDDYGPLWYRGLSGEGIAAAPETVQAILDHNKAKHIVVGHTPTSGVIWPSYDGRIIQIDTGISAAYGGFVAYLEISSEGMFAGYPGGKISLPSGDGDQVAYLEQVIAMDSGNKYLQQRLTELTAPPPVVEPEPEPEPEVQSDETSTATADGGVPESEEPELPIIPICGISQ